MICLAKTTIQEDSTKKNSFEEAVDFIMITAPKDTILKRPHNISGLGSNYNQNNKGERFAQVPNWSRATFLQEERVEEIIGRVAG